MATCPECGGRLIPLRRFLANPWRPMPCRWCRATVEPVRIVRRLRDLLILVLAIAVGVGFGLPAWRHHDPFAAVALIAGWLFLLFLFWVLEVLFPLQTVIPRDARWSRQARRDDDEAT